MVQVERKDLVALFQQGVAGNASSFTLLARRLVSRMRREDPASADELLKVLGYGSVVRRAVSPPSAESAGLLKEEDVVHFEYEPVWPDHVRVALETVLEERRLADKLRGAGLEPIKAVLFQGPPGGGKTFAARWLARELRLPLLTLDLATVMSSLLGKTGSNIKTVIDRGASFPCVLFLDEFDAIAKRRDDDRDVGELKRLVTVLLQAVDEWPSTSLLVAATNHAELLDPAVWRRFEVNIAFGAPTEIEIEAFLIHEGVGNPSARRLAAVLAGSVSFADLRRHLLSARKASVLGERPLLRILEEEILLNSRDKAAARDIQIRALAAEGLSQRRIAEQLGISHPTVGRVLKESRGDSNGNS
jgi:SpoVK/Ycf46/Vps4 family AAA+-type ATPase